MHSNQKRIRRKRFFLWIQMFFIAVLIISIFAVSSFLIWATTIEIPDFSLFETRKVSQSTKIYDRTGKIVLYDVHKDVRRTLVTFDKISPEIKNATVAIEDEEFYDHIGIKPTAILRAVWVNIREMEYSQGGSTITQQVIKNALLSQEKTISRKVKEWILALKLEQIMTKEEILELYLNDAPYGGNIYGVEEASMTYFGKHASEVGLAEAAYLAAIPQAPTRYSPYGNNIDKLEARKNLVLKRMYDLNMITNEEYEKFRNEVVKFQPPRERGILAPHFVMYIREILVDMYGEDVITEGGLRVTTTLDMELQKAGEEIVAQYVKENEKNFNASNAGLIAVDPKTGHILTMVGSRDYFDTENEGNFNTTLAKRQPGSAFKPFIYAAAFEQGYTPDTTLFNVRTEFSTFCDPFGEPIGGVDKSKCYRPENYDHTYNGPVSLRNALAQSMNVPAVKLLYLTGLNKAIDISERLGITTLGDKSQYGLTLVLGGGEVTLLEMTSAYGVFANDGKRNQHTGLLKVEDNKGVMLYEFKKNETQVIDENVARQISDVLSDNIARAPAFGSDSYLNVKDRTVAVKTGTTNNYKDAWIIGYTPNLSVGAWAGNNDNSSMEKKVAGFIIAPLWNAFFTTATSTASDERFTPPRPIDPNLKPALRGIWYGGTTYKVDKISGKFATEHTPQYLIEERVIPNPHEILFWVNKNDPTGPAPVNPHNDPQYLLWEIPAQQWITENGVPANAWNSIPEGFDDLHLPEYVPTITVSEPLPETTLTAGQKTVVRSTISSHFPIKHVDFFVNDTFLGSLTNPPYDFSFIPTYASTTRSTIRIIANDTVGNKKESVTNVTIVE